MKIEVISTTLPGNKTNKEEFNKFSGHCAGICYMADTFEAIIAAIYLDGGLDSATQFVLPFVEEMLKNNKNAMFEDYKTILQEIIQQNPEEHLEYILAKESGPDHNKKFTINVCLNTKSVVLGSGTGKSKKEAEQQAAKKVLELMGHHY